MEEHLANSHWLGGSDVPCDYNNVLKLLKKLGYCDPQHFKVCVDENHSVLLNAQEKSCPNCMKLSSQCIDYYVLGLCVDQWFKTEECCEHLLGHWRDREEWFKKDPKADISMSELWHCHTLGSCHTFGTVKMQHFILLSAQRLFRQKCTDKTTLLF